MSIITRPRVPATWFLKIADTILEESDSIEEMDHPFSKAKERPSRIAKLSPNRAEPQTYNLLEKPPTTTPYSSRTTAPNSQRIRRSTSSSIHINLKRPRGRSLPNWVPSWNFLNDTTNRLLKTLKIAKVSEGVINDHRSFLGKIIKNPTIPFFSNRPSKHAEKG